VSGWDLKVNVGESMTDLLTQAVLPSLPNLET
jgi:hypothetical protein